MHRILLGLVVWLVVSGCTTPLGERHWISVSSAHFEILSTMREDEVVDLVSHLERFRALIFTATRVPRTDSPVPTEITVFARKHDITRYTGERNIGGFFHPGMRANTVVLADVSANLGAREIILHEYVHFILRNGSQVDYPMWYDEGFAEFLSTARVHEDQIAIGIFPKARIGSFKHGVWIPIERIVSATTYSDFSSNEQHMFYAEAWALVHYLSLGRDDSASLGAQLTQYLNFVENGASHAAAFEHAFGESPRQVDNALIRKLRKSDWRAIGIPLASLDYDPAPPVVRIATTDEVAIRLGQLQLARGAEGAEAAQDQFEAALRANPHSARAKAGLGDALKFQQRWDQAEPYFYQAVELAPADPLNELDLAEYLADRAQHDPTTGNRRERILQAREALARSLALDDSIPETWAILGHTYLLAGEDAAQSLEPVQRAYQMLPSEPTIVALLAEAYVANGYEIEARNLLRRSVAVGENGNSNATLDERIQEIRDRRSKAAGDLEGSR